MRWASFRSRSVIVRGLDYGANVCVSQRVRRMGPLKLSLHKYVDYDPSVGVVRSELGTFVHAALEREGEADRYHIFSWTWYPFYRRGRFGAIAGRGHGEGTVRWRKQLGFKPWERP